MAFDLNNPLISVVMPVFNRRQLVMRAINSVEAQTIDDWELLIVDDGSWDAVEQDILPLVAERPNYRYMKHAQRRLSATRNIGIHAALGHFVTFLDSDDEYRPDHLELRLAFMKKNPDIDIIHGGVQIIGPPETHYVQDAFHPDKKIHISRCCVGATFFGKKEAFIKSGGFKELAYSAESELLPRLEALYNVKKIDFPTYCYHTGLRDSICAQRGQATKK